MFPWMDSVSLINFYENGAGILLLYYILYLFQFCFRGVEDERLDNNKRRRSKKKFKVMMTKHRNVTVI